MKVTLPASQLTDADITHVSLVKHGANRTPFKILKAEALPEDGSLGRVADRVRKMFGTPEKAPKITAVYVDKSVARDVLPVLKDAGLRVDVEHAALLDNCVVLKQEGYDPEASEGSVIALSETVAVQLDTVAKEFTSWSMSADFTRNLQSLGFYPGTWLAFDALRETIYQIMYSAQTPDEAAAPLDAALKQFSKHVLGLARALPVELFKTEQKLASGFEGRTVAAADPISKSEGAPMKHELREAVAGDLAGLFAPVAKADEAAAATAAAGATDAGAAEAAAADAGAADAAATAAAAAETGTEGTAAAAPADAAAAAAAPAEGAAVQKDQLGAEDIIKAMREGMGQLHQMVTKQAEDHAAALADLNARLDTVAKTAVEAVTTAKTAVAKADNTVTVVDVASDSFNLEGTLHTRSAGAQRVTKSNAPREDADVWQGLFPGLDALQARLKS